MVVLKKKKMSKFNVGDMVLMTRKPTDDDWYHIGEVDIPSEFYTTPQRIVDVNSSRSIMLADNGWSYPASCFELAPTPNVNTTEAKPGDYIVILDGRGASHLKYKTFYVVNITPGKEFHLAAPGAGEEPTIRWMCSDPSCYEIKHSSLVMKEHEPKEHSDIGMSNYEPPKEFKVGDNVQVTVDGIWFNAGQVAKILEIKGDIIQMYSAKRSMVLGIHKAYLKHTDGIPVITGEYPKYKVDLPVFDHGHITKRLRELQTEYFKQIKNQHNGTESNKQSVKLQGVNLKIREGNPIRGIGLKSSGSKIKLRSYHSYN